MATEYKTCPKCKRTLLRTEWFYRRKSGERMRWESYCKDCCRAANGKGGKNYEKAKERHRSWYHNNRTDQLEKNRMRQVSITQRRKEEGYFTEQARREREVLSTGYVKSLFRHSVPRDLVSDDMVNLKRMHIEVKRARKLITNELEKINETSKDNT